MKPAEPLALNHSWPLFEQGLRFDLGQVGIPALDGVVGMGDDQLASLGIGRWSCDLSTRALQWSRGVHALFDWHRDRPLDRAEVLPLYRPESCAAMERLRAYAIRHRRGFTLDIAVAAGAGTRWLRLIAAPICRGQRTIALHGLKIDIDAQYR